MVLMNNKETKVKRTHSGFGHESPHNESIEWYVKH